MRLLREKGQNVDRAKGTWKMGQIVLDKPTDWPEGCRVLVEPADEEEPLGIREEDWPTTPEALADWVHWFDSLEPVELSEQDEAEWQSAREAVKAHSIANMHKRIEGLFE
jgi:hypothetical protein